ncbi:hypothetical protein CSPX01_13993 [Colletotrichum filicis]|nr:hypothetical protein CSPX01_13993 [Colletotrichum filicis]
MVWLRVARKYALLLPALLALVTAIHHYRQARSVTSQMERVLIIGRSNSSNTITAPITNSSDSRTGMQESDTRLRHFPRPSYCCLGATGGRLVCRLRFACHG